MRNIRRFIRIALLLIVGLFLHYVMPQQDVARVTSTEIIRTDFGGWQRLFFAQADSGQVDNVTRDLRLINTERLPTYMFGLIRGGSPETMVYRNEDTGWIYPPYFKFDSSDLQAEASAAISTAVPQEWVVVTHYGWRIRWASIYPNAVAIRPILVADGESPLDYRPFPWVNLIIFVVLIIGLVFVRAMWMQFRERTLDPIADSAGDRLDHVNADLAERRGRFRRWLDTWKSK
ncbi:DUF1523 family protein [Pseudooctadecabacter jejudonensis]|uniref:DUF1523 domain-containing protein n=1 Tax=Pseudooctadecabacter jejudonensis TaxID=1391910 RepID=A0A1Y5T6C9_9RHOB|nr:DUF1523 family protein [Pseudooctadecabacter jejudonensis]SLN56365.1 hypothetical protein PSJ8397_02989 [Pseudooctadecabacter jejudonensis]